ncbi:MAG: DEAD/DEAH box helicase family protein, partial [Candidatus Micrarchaeota archaeon]
MEKIQNSFQSLWDHDFEDMKYNVIIKGVDLQKINDLILYENKLIVENQETSTAPELAIEKNYIIRYDELLSRLITESGKRVEIDAITYSSNLNEKIYDILFKPKAVKKLRIICGLPEISAKTDVLEKIKTLGSKVEIRANKGGELREELHAKIIFLKYKDIGQEVVIFGSSNLSFSGWHNNMELNSVFVLKEGDFSHNFEWLWEKFQNVSISDIITEQKKEFETQECKDLILKEPFTLLGYQNRVLKSIEQWASKIKENEESVSRKRFLVSLPTGTGKTTILSKFILNQFKAKQDLPPKILVLVQRREMVKHFYDELHRLMDISELRSFYPYEEIPDDRHNSSKVLSPFYHNPLKIFQMYESLNPRADTFEENNIIIATSAKFYFYLKKRNRPYFDYIIVDEVHHYDPDKVNNSNMLQNIMDGGGYKNKPQIGLSATPYRAKGKNWRDGWEEAVNTEFYGGVTPKIFFEKEEIRSKQVYEPVEIDFGLPKMTFKEDDIKYEGRVNDLFKANPEFNKKIANLCFQSKEKCKEEKETPKILVFTMSIDQAKYVGTIIDEQNISKSEDD